MKPPYPFLRWAGSKRQLISELAPFWMRGRYNKYFEPFMGSACLFFAIQPPAAVLSDSNSELVEVFRCVRSQPLDVHLALGQMSVGREAYYHVRQLDPRSLPLVDRAARFIYLNRYCFNGLFRTNRNGAFNVPYGPTKAGDLPTKEELLAAAAALSSAEILSGDFQSVLNQPVAGDFVYLDPPYAASNSRIFRQYGPQCFGISDLHRLGLALEQLDHRGVHFVVSYASTPESQQVFRKWAIRTVSAQRNISGFAKHRKRADELIVSNQSWTILEETSGNHGEEVGCDR